MCCFVIYESIQLSFDINLCDSVNNLYQTEQIYDRARFRVIIKFVSKDTKEVSYVIVRRIGGLSKRMRDCVIMVCNEKNDKSMGNQG